MVLQTRRLTLSLLVTMACLGTASLGESPAQAVGEKTVTITEKEEGTKVKVPKGDTLVVKLDAQPSTGFRWVVAKVDKGKLAQQGKDEFEKPDKKVVGGKVKQVFRF